VNWGGPLMRPCSILARGRRLLRRGRLLTGAQRTEGVAGAFPGCEQLRVFREAGSVETVHHRDDVDHVPGDDIQLGARTDVCRPSAGEALHRLIDLDGECGGLPPPGVTSRLSTAVLRWGWCFPDNSAGGQRKVGSPNRDDPTSERLRVNSVTRPGIGPAVPHPLEGTDM
jgi:hypothetical protein